MAIKEKAGPKMFFRIRPVEILLSLKEGPKYASVLSRENNCTYSHTVKLLDEFRRISLVEFEKKGRIKIVKLTDDGQGVASGLFNTMSKLTRLKERN